MSLHFLGADFDYGALLNAGGQIADVIIKSDAAAKAFAADKAKLATATAADAAAASAISTALLSKMVLATAMPATRDKAAAQATADENAANLALSASDKAGALVPAALAGDRLEAANQAYAAVTTALQKDATNPAAQAKVKAWEQVIGRLQNRQIVTEGGAQDKGDKGSPADPNWFTQHTLISAVPNYGVVLGGVGIAGAVGLAVKKGIFSRLFR